MRTIRLVTDIAEACFFQRDVTRGAAIDHAKLRNPNLLNAAFEVTAKCDRVASGADQSEIPFLVVAPLAEVIFGGGDRKENQQ